MYTKDNRQDVHDKIDHIFKDLLPAKGMAERPEQIALSHQMLNAMLDGSIALCDAGTGIGKTFAYLLAGTMFQQSQAKPILISTSSIALQNAVQNEYLPFLSETLLADRAIDEPIQSVIRKGKSHYVCDERLERRLNQVRSSKKNPTTVVALHSLREHLDADKVPGLSRYDLERVCVPQVCDCQRNSCRYITFLVACDLGLLPCQLRFLEKISKHEGWELVDIYADEARTGTRTDKREDFNRLLTDCRKGKIDKVLVKSISRFARNTKDCLAALRELTALGVSVYFEEENINTETFTTELMVSVSGSLA